MFTSPSDWWLTFSGLTARVGSGGEGYHSPSEPWPTPATNNCHTETAAQRGFTAVRPFNSLLFYYFCHQNGWHVTKDIEFREAYMSLGGRSGLWPLDQGCRQVSLETLGDQTPLGNFGTCPDYPSCMRKIAILTDHFFAFWKMLSYPLRVYGCVSLWCICTLVYIWPYGETISRSLP